MKTKILRQFCAPVVRCDQFDSGRLIPGQISRLALLTSLLMASCLIACSSSSKGGSDSEFPTISDSDLELEANRYGDGNIPEAREGNLFKDIHFAYDSSEVDPQYHEMLRENAKILGQDSTIQTEIEGHCDRRGTNEYNLALGQERAKAVAALIVSFGARPNQVGTISYGEEIPIDPGNSETAFSKNRRAHFALYRKDSPRQ